MMRSSGAMGRSWHGLTLAAAFTVAVAAHTPGAAAAQDTSIASEVGLAKALWEHGIYQPAESIAHNAVAAHPEALVYEALALGGRAKTEGNPKLLEEAKKILAQAVAKKIRGAKEAEPFLTNPPAPTFLPGDKELDFAWRL